MSTETALRIFLNALEQNPITFQVLGIFQESGFTGSWTIKDGTATWSDDGIYADIHLYYRTITSEKTKSYDVAVDLSGVMFVYKHEEPNWHFEVGTAIEEDKDFEYGFLSKFPELQEAFWAWGKAQHFKKVEMSGEEFISFVRDHIAWWKTRKTT